MRANIAKSHPFTPYCLLFFGTQTKFNSSAVLIWAAGTHPSLYDVFFSLMYSNTSSDIFERSSWIRCFRFKTTPPIDFVAERRVERNTGGPACLHAKADGIYARTILFDRANQRAVGLIGRGRTRNSPFGRAQRGRTWASPSRGTRVGGCICYTSPS